MELRLKPHVRTGTWRRDRTRTRARMKEPGRDTPQIWIASRSSIASNERRANDTSRSARASRVRRHSGSDVGRGRRRSRRDDIGAKRRDAEAEAEGRGRAQAPLARIRCGVVP